MPRPYPLVEAFLILEQPRQRLSHWTQALAPLDDERAPPLAAVSAFYDPTCDQALLGLSYDQLALGGERLSFVVEVALLAEIGMIQPTELSDGDRRRFLGERLSRCTLTVSHRKVVGALTELVRRVKDQKQPRPAKEPTKPGRGDEIPLLASGPNGVFAIVDPLLVQPRSTRDDVGKLRRVQMPALSEPGGPATASASTVVAHVPAPPRQPPAPTAQLRPVHAASRNTPAPSPSLPPPVPSRSTPPPIPASSRTSSRHVIARASSPQPRQPHPERDHISTETMDPLAAQKLAATDLPPVPILDQPTRAHEQPRIAEGSHEMYAIEPYAPVTTPLPPGCIFARYLRSGRWVPVRVGALSLRGAALMAGALPRLQDHVQVAFAFEEHRAILRGTVHKVSSPEETAQRGAASFSVAFELGDATRKTLTALLQAARAAKVTIKPPPPRGNRRYPVEWPVCLGTSRGAIRGDALDVSREGLFVRPANALSLDTNLGFSIVLDDRGEPVSGRSRVARYIDDAGAQSCGLAPGYGLHIVEMSAADQARWAGFVARIERRSELRVLVGAAASRLNELQRGLAAAGYAVAGAADPESLLSLASREESTVDACLIDAGWPPLGAAPSWSEALFPGRRVPCVALRGDARRAREAIDQVLGII